MTSLARERSRDRHVQAGEGFLKLRRGQTHLNNLMAEACFSHALRFKHDLKMRCLGGCASQTWLWLESAWTKQHSWRDRPRLKWCRACDGDHKEFWEVRVPKEVMDMFSSADHRRYLSSEEPPHAASAGPKAAGKGEPLAIEDRRPGPSPMSPGPGPWGEQMPSSSSLSSIPKASAMPQTPRTRPAPTPVPLMLPAGWVRLESARTPGLLYYKHEESGRTQFEHPSLNSPPAPSPPPGQTTVVVQQHRSTMVQGAAAAPGQSDMEYSEFLCWRASQQQVSRGPFDQYS